MAKARKQFLNPAQLPLFTPDSEWVAPNEWPELSRAEYIAVDTETYDPYLQERGPGFIRGDARVCGISLATELGHKLYLPFGHSEGNIDKEKAIAYVKDVLSKEGQEKVGANLTYDLEALWSLGIEVKGKLNDIQIAEPLLDEDRPGGYSLEVLSKAYLGEGKDEQLLKEAEVSFGVEHKKGMHHLPAKYVGPYAEVDAENSLFVYLQQKEELQADDVWDIYELERDLLPVLFRMRLKGVRIDEERIRKAAFEARNEEKILHNQLIRIVGHERFNIASADSLAPILRERGIDLPLTLKNNYSLTNEFLLQHSKDEFCSTLINLRKTTKMRSDFIEGSILGSSVKGRLHTQWHQLRDYDEEEGHSKGTRSGRIASSKPNLTQIPSRDPKWGKLIRSFFIADEGEFWCKADYSQQEPRILLHFACMTKIRGEYLKGAHEARQRYIDDPSMDYHQLVADLVKERSGKDIGRRAAKDINLGSAYGMGKHKMARKLGVSKEVATEIFDAYHAGVPYVKQLEKACMNRVTQFGFIRTILGRKRRFKEWEPYDFELKYGAKPTRDYEEACRLWGGPEKVSRAGIHKALNALVQGSAADMMKRALINLDSEGIPPLLQIYDECNASYSNHQQVRLMQEIMETVIPQITVPFIAEPDMGKSWGEVKPYYWQGTRYEPK